MPDRRGKHRTDKCSFGCYWTAPQKALYKLTAEVEKVDLTTLVSTLLGREARMRGIVDLDGKLDARYQADFDRLLKMCNGQTEDGKIQNGKEEE